MALPQTYLDQIKKFEGFYQKPYWDYKQWTSGYGTRAAGPNDVVDQVEAERRLQAEIANAATLVDRFAPNLDPGTRAALTSLTYNSGGKWMESGLGQAIKSGDMDAARASFQQYTQAGGQTLPGLVNRRQAELGWFGQTPNDPRNTTPSGGGYGVDPDGAYGVAGAVQTADVGDAGVTLPKQPTPSSTPLTGSQQGMGLLAGMFSEGADPMAGLSGLLGQKPGDTSNMELAEAARKQAVAATPKQGRMFNVKTEQLLPVLTRRLGI